MFGWFEKCRGCGGRMIVGIFCKDCAYSLAIWAYTNEIDRKNLDKLLNYYKTKKN